MVDKYNHAVGRSSETKEFYAKIALFELAKEFHALAWRHATHFLRSTGNVSLPKPVGW